MFIRNLKIYIVMSARVHHSVSPPGATSWKRALRGCNQLDMSGE